MTTVRSILSLSHGGLFVWSGGDNILSHLATSLALEPNGSIIVAGTRTVAVEDTSETNLVVLRLLTMAVWGDPSEREVPTLARQLESSEQFN